MKLLEYEAKNLLTLSGIVTSRSSIIHRNDSPHLTLPVVLKSQVPTGGRGKAGGIRIVDDKESLQQTINELFELPIKGFRPQTLLAEEKLAIAHEYYLSLVIDKPAAEIRVMAHTNGGVEVEENPQDSFLGMVVSRWDMVDGESGRWDVVGQQLADYYNLPGQSFVLQDLVENLYKCFVTNDATLLEINPFSFYR